MSKISVMVVEDNLLVSTAVKDILEEEEYEVKVAENGKAAAALLKKHSFDLVLLDMMLPDTDGRSLLAKWQKSNPDLLIVIMTAYGDVNTAVDCLKNGAYDFLTKPVERTLLLKTIHNAVSNKDLTRKVDVLTKLNQRKTEKPDAETIVATSPVMLDALKMLELIAGSDFSCLFITGESGTGKGLFARTIHRKGNRADKPFVEINCSALPPTLIESELFGHKRGSFTDAKEDKTGLFEMANEGTIFLDEIGDMDIALQAKLLKVIEEQRLRRVGSTVDVNIDVAVIAATNQNVEELVNQGKFRLDLYYRLNVVPLEIPPLRRRLEDIPALANYFITILSRKFGKTIRGFSEDAMVALMTYDWPGNVREFRNVVERGCILTRGDVIDDKSLLFPSLAINTNTDDSAFNGGIPAMPLAKAEELVIIAAMRKADGNKNQAARILGVHRTTLYKKLEEYKIPDDVSNLPPNRGIMV